MLMADNTDRDQYTEYLSSHELQHMKQCMTCYKLWPKYYEYNVILLERSTLDTQRNYSSLSELHRIALAEHIDDSIQRELFKLIPRRIPSAYQLYLKECKQSIHSDAPLKWKHLSDDIKDPFQQRATQLRITCKRKLKMLTPRLKAIMDDLRRQPNRKLPNTLQEIVLNYDDTTGTSYKRYLKEAASKI